MGLSGGGRLFHGGTGLLRLVTHMNEWIIYSMQGGVSTPSKGCDKSTLDDGPEFNTLFFLEVGVHSDCCLPCLSILLPSPDQPSFMPPPSFPCLLPFNQFMDTFASTEVT